MKAAKESRVGLDSGGLLGERIYGLRGVAWRYSGLLQSTSLRGRYEFVAAFRRTARLLPMVLGLIDADLIWILRVVDDDGGGAGLASSGALNGHFLISGLVGYDLSPLETSDAAFTKALHGTWQHSVASLCPLNDQPTDLHEHLGLKQGVPIENADGLIDVSDNLYRLLLMGGK